MKIGVSLKINLSKIDKARIFEGEKGKYYDMTAFIDLDSEDQYGNNGFISESVTEDERKAKVKGTILGNSKVFWKGEGTTQAGYDKGISDAKQAVSRDEGYHVDIPDDDIPF